MIPHFCETLQHWEEDMYFFQPLVARKLLSIFYKLFIDYCRGMEWVCFTSFLVILLQHASMMEQHELVSFLYLLSGPMIQCLFLAGTVWHQLFFSKNKCHSSKSLHCDGWTSVYTLRLTGRGLFLGLCIQTPIQCWQCSFLFSLFVNVGTFCILVAGTWRLG